MLDSPLIRRARELARAAHEGHFRKAGGVPYFFHLESVAQLLVQHGYADEVTIAAAYLHDLLEDRPAFGDRLRAEMPRDVVDVIAVLTEPKHDVRGALRPKRARFEDYLAQLSSNTEAARRAIPISCADKIDNARSIAAAPALLGKLSTRPGEHREHFARLRRIYARHVRPELLATFDAARRALLDAVRAWLPGRAVAIAADAHLGQYDKAGAPYIYHPLRLMMRARTDEERIVAVLHDVVEDGEWTFDALRREGFSRDVVRAIEHLTKQEGESYEAFIERVADDRLATRVKILDLEDNSDLSRLREPTEKDRARAATYARALERLRAVPERRSLYVVLDEDSELEASALAIHPDVRGDHVTLAFAVDPTKASPAWIPGGHRVGDRVDVHVTGMVADERAQALVVEIGGSSKRPWDGGTLHVTVSVAPGARARESNDVIAEQEPVPLDMHLRGTVMWVD
jgi:hypothetical protein